MGAEVLVYREKYWQCASCYESICYYSLFYPCLRKVAVSEGLRSVEKSLARKWPSLRTRGRKVREFEGRK